MKSANPLSVDQVEVAIWKNPIDEITILNAFHEDDKLLASCLIGAFVTISNTQRDTLALIKSLSEDKTNKITATQLSRFFLLHEDLLTDFSFIDQKLRYKGKEIKATCPTITLLAIKLEDYFGSKDIDFTIILMALKRYFIRKDNQSNEVFEFIAKECRDYLENYTTKKKTKIPLKFVKDLIPDKSVAELKAFMLEAGYKEVKSSQGRLFFIAIGDN